MNKADRTSDEERQNRQIVYEQDARKAASPARRLASTRSAPKSISRNQGPERDWAQLIAALEKLVRESGRDLVRAAGERGFKRLAAELLTIISEERDALCTPD